MTRSFFKNALLLLCVSLTVQLYAQVPQATPVKVTIQKLDSGYQLLRGGVPYYIKGAGGESHMRELAEHGGNSVRTWGSRGGQKVLDSAAHYGLTVLMGLDVASERHGFNYDDTAAVRKQLDRLRQEVLKYRNHPALLGWGIGNELNLQYKNPSVWNAVNDISKMIHALDPNHPTSTVLAGVSREVVDQIKTRCPDIDLLCVNTYGGLATLPRAIRQSGWSGAYMVTEWGPTGHWEGLQTAWRSPIEETSSEKAAVYKSRYEYSMLRDKLFCLGSYVFLWGQKQERTPTWYGLFTEAGETSEVIDALQFLWTGKWPVNMAPHIYSLQIGEKSSVEDVYLKAGNEYPVLALASDIDRDVLSFRWEVLPEPTKVGEGGDHEDRPRAVGGLLSARTGGGKQTMKAPATPGAFRLFVYVTDGKGKVATANLPFYVNP